MYSIHVHYYPLTLYKSGIYLLGVKNEKKLKAEGKHAYVLSLYLQAILCNFRMGDVLCLVTGV